MSVTPFRHSRRGGFRPPNNRSSSLLSCLLRLQNCTFTANTATHYGGAVYKPLVGPLSIVASTSDGNTAVQGGAVYAPLGMTSVAASKFTNNRYFRLG